MKKSYLKSETANNDRVYFNNSYLTNSTSSFIAKYSVLPNEYAILPNIDLIEETASSEQVQFLKSFLIEINNVLLAFYSEKGIRKKLPKMTISIDEDKAIALNWVYPNARIYFIFEKEKKASYYGFTAQTAKSGFSSFTDELTEDNQTEVILKMLDFVINNS
ncbi:hypothetical protein LJC34_01900 [Oscillospiraceae bacterium OttesenSCG-928-G22]|nr:hypothetical protein [Oscillospiraceae bacterium OttesenSCG-928-G22]